MTAYNSDPGIDWNETHNVFVGQESGEYFVQVGMNLFMEVSDFIEGGRAELRNRIHESLVKVARLSNLAIDAGSYADFEPEDYDGKVI